jgi:hypothetical protein
LTRWLLRLFILFAKPRKAWLLDRDWIILYWVLGLIRETAAIPWLFNFLRLKRWLGWLYRHLCRGSSHRYLFEILHSFIYYIICNLIDGLFNISFGLMVEVTLGWLDRI